MREQPCSALGSRLGHFGTQFNCFPFLQTSSIPGRWSGRRKASRDRRTADRQNPLRRAKRTGREIGISAGDVEGRRDGAGAPAVAESVSSQPSFLQHSTALCAPLGAWGGGNHPRVAACVLLPWVRCVLWAMLSLKRSRGAWSPARPLRWALEVWS